ncbi:hypothetical protein [Mycobacteroides abscessus]|uniref:hypothetical protein n=1 Tax=Mycobacteroides abscessus TaxID=36809 RepID=UPI00092C58EF|nr:hypothetical protein [Mycobacteroides abscessus]SHW53665.1 Uncharacterised protein [Mycobacteroides abscessus subsp. abscessus]SIA40291.1 Uncharacterised protein [Mycobacteroides abscessus subsp. abscessus]SKR77162.1 Uncharacterised protein [Mycobacteroides abscessus subsp. abscessus]
MYSFVCPLNCGASYRDEWQLHLHCHSHEKKRWLPFNYNKFGEIMSFKERHGPRA